MGFGDSIEDYRTLPSGTRSILRRARAAERIDPKKADRAGGRAGIRTLGGFNPTLDFESSALNRTQPPFLLLSPAAFDLARKGRPAQAAIQRTRRRVKRRLRLLGRDLLNRGSSLALGKVEVPRLPLGMTMEAQPSAGAGRAKKNDDSWPSMAHGRRALCLRSSVKCLTPRAKKCHKIILAARRFSTACCMSAGSAPLVIVVGCN